VPADFATAAGETYGGCDLRHLTRTFILVQPSKRRTIRERSGFVEIGTKKSPSTASGEEPPCAQGKTLPTTNIREVLGRETFRQLLPLLLVTA